MLTEEGMEEWVSGVYICSLRRATWVSGHRLHTQATVSIHNTENISLQARYLTYANYENLSLDQIDHRLDVTLAAKLTQYINVNFSAIALYDFDQIDELQFSQLIGVGILLNREKAVVE